MRAIALVAGGETGFSPGASGFIVGLFTLTAAGSFASALLARRFRLLGILVCLAACVPLWVPGTSSAITELRENAHGNAVQIAGEVAIGLLIVAAMVIAPLAGWRSGRRALPSVD